MLRLASPCSCLGRLGRRLFFGFFCSTLPLFLLLLVFLAFGLWLQNIVHEVVDVHVRELLVDCLALLVLRFKLLSLPLVHSSLLLIGALPFLPKALMVVALTPLGHAATHTLSPLECSLMFLERMAVSILVLANRVRVAALGALLPLRLPHLLVLLLQL